MTRYRPGRHHRAMTIRAAQPTARRDWLIPTALIVLVLVPVLAGADRVAQLAGGAQVTPQNARFFDQPVPVLVHIFAASTYTILGAFQFSPGLRRRRPRWHRLAGRVLVPCGLAVALSGLWMALFYPDPPGDGNLLLGFRLVFGSAMLLSIVTGFAAILRGNVARHRAWMTRGYAIAVGAGTQAAIGVPIAVAASPLTGTPRALSLAAGWVINLAVAEWVIRRGPVPASRRARPAQAPA
jgi:uncharacterized membrane protein